MNKSKKSLADIWGFRFFLNSRKTYVLILKIVLMLVIPYAYLMLCGLVFDHFLKWYFMTSFIFISLIILFVIALTLSIWAVVRFLKYKRGLKYGARRY